MIYTPPALGADSPAVDRLLGGEGRAQLAARLAQAAPGGRKHAWAAYAAWGRELFTTGQVKEPPLGPSPSPRVSQVFVCTDCHNIGREDPVLTQQDPEARLSYLVAKGHEGYLLQAAPVFGMVNRRLYYPGDFVKYHDLCVANSWGPRTIPCGPVFGFCGPGCRTMDPTHLEDATQICASYCSVGRYLEEWEMLSLLAFFWDHELRLDDLGLSQPEAQEVVAALGGDGSDPARAQAARRLLESRFPSEAAMTLREMPRLSGTEKGGTVKAAYKDGRSLVGDAARGKQVYLRSCGRCHGTAVEKEEGAELGKDAEEFYEMLTEGSRSWFWAYMPNYCEERLSRQQAADVLAYCRSLPPE